MLTKSFIEFLYDAAHIQRWNEHIRPSGFTELDKQAHKMMIMYVLARHEEDDHGAQLNWRLLIEGGIFEFLQRNVLTDIKPQIFHEMMRVYGKELNAWVYQELRRRIPDIQEDFMEKMQLYFENPQYCAMEKKILRAAHYLATKWEFELIYHFNEGIYGSEDTKAVIENELEDHYDLAAVKKLALKGKSSKFIDLVGQLRFQKRWAQSPRVPETSVMGHVLLVAIMGYFCAVKLGACDERTFIVALLACGWPNNKSYKWSDMRTLMTYALDHYQYKTFEIELPVRQIFINNGIKAHSDTIAYPGKNGTKIFLTANLTPVSFLLKEDETISVDYEIPDQLDAPVRKGMQVGRIRCTLNDKLIREYPVYTTQNAEKRTFKKCVEYIFHLFSIQNSYQKAENIKKDQAR